VKKIDEGNEIKQVVLMVENKKHAEGLLYQLLGKKIIERQIEKIVQTGINNLVFLLPLAADDLRAEIRKIAINYPIRIATYNLEAKYSSWQNLVRMKDMFEERFFFASAVTVDLIFLFEQMRSWVGDLIMSGQKEKYELDLGSVKGENKYVTACSHLAMKDYLYLTGNYVISLKFLTFAQERMFLHNNWQKVVHEFCQEQVVKICEFAPTEVMPPIEKFENYGLALAKKWWLEVYQKNELKGEIAPTVRMTGEVMTAEGAKVGEYSLIQGPVYLGKKVIVGNFCQLGPNLFLEEEVEIDHYSQIEEKCWRKKRVINQLKMKVLDK